MIEFNQVSLHRGTKSLLEKSQLRIHDGQKVALIGANGAGKSSLFGLLNGELESDAGELTIPRQWRIAYMRQEVHSSARSALDYVIDGHQLYRHIEQQLQNAENDQQMASAIDQMEQHQAYDAPVTAEKLLHGLGFSQSDLKRSVSDFSGGWQIRLNLAQALMMPSDLLLLDEPTNHLDLEATLWLEQWLQNYAGTLLFISHDRDFIDGVAGNIVHLDQQQLHLYPGNYSAYERIRAEKLAQQQSLFEKQQSRIQQIESFVTRFKAKASKAKQAQSRVKELERMQLIAPAHVDSPFQFEFPCYEKMSTPLMSFDEANLGYQDRLLLKNVNLSVLPGHRIGLLGANGTGKSTLLKALVNSATLQSGVRQLGEHCRIGYFAQQQLESLDLQATPALMLQRLRPEASEQQIRNFLGGFGFNGDQALATIAPFSGGEKARLALAAIAWQEPNLLILDEPTNHLDIEMREALAMALQNFPGAILIVSHDRHLLKSTVDQYWLIRSGKLEEFDGDLEDYHQFCQQNESDSDQSAGQATTSGNDSQTPSSIDRKLQKKREAEQRQKLAPLRKEFKQVDNKLSQLQKQLQEVEQHLADTALYETDRKAELTSKLDEQLTINKELQKIEGRWFELMELLEG